ncbi:Monoterpene epsilon-lactone hydrolase [compost metagenome]
MENLNSAVSIEPTVHEVIAPHFGAAIGGPTDRKPASVTPFVNIPEWVSPEMRAFMRLLEDPAITLPPFPAPDNIAAWEQTAARMETQWIQKYAPYIQSVDPRIDEITLGGVTCYDIRPKNLADDSKVLIYMHGGAYVVYRAGGSMLGRGVMAADLWNVRVVSIDFSLAPRRKFDEITDECVAAVSALVEQGIPLKNIAFYGDSAGGSLAAAVVLKMRDRGLGMPAALAMVSPWLDVTLDPDSLVSLQNQETSYVMQHVKAAGAAWADPKDQKNPYASPVYGDFTKGYIPTMIQGGLKEILLSGMVRMYEKLEDAEIPVKLDLWEAMPHNFPDRVPNAPESIRARKRMGAFLRAHLGLT